MGQRAKDRTVGYYKRVVSQAANEAALNNIEAHNFKRLIGAGIVRPVVDGQRLKMTEAEHNRIIWHLDIPVCRILQGLKIHLATISLAERWRLCYRFSCSSIEQLAKVMWLLIKLRKKKV